MFLPSLALLDQVEPKGRTFAQTPFSVGLGSKVKPIANHDRRASFGSVEDASKPEGASHLIGVRSMVQVHLGPLNMVGIGSPSALP